MAFRDQYTDFTFDDKKSSSYKVWITNKNDIEIALTPNFKDKFTSPQFGGVRYLDGTTFEKTDIKIPCVAIDITLNEWRAICDWLSPIKIGRLTFDYNKYMYYTVKLSNSVNAKMFNLRGKDSLLGGRKVVEFSLTFTTVGDYAAQGVLNTAALGDSATERSVEELINRSTNHYRMPNILMDVPGENIQDQDIVTGLRFTMTPNEENKYISWKCNGLTYQIQHLQGNDVKYSVFKSEEQSSTPEVYYEGLIQNYVDVDGLEAVYLPFPSGTNLNAPLEVDQTVLNIFNCGEHDMYPTITLNEVEKSFSVWLDDVKYYDYQLAINKKLNNIVIDCQSGHITYNGRLIENVSDPFGYRFIETNYNQGPLTIPSGNPEIHKAKFNGEKDGYWEWTLDSPMIHNYDDDLDLCVCFTKDIETDVHYNTGLYNQGVYEPHLVDGSVYGADVHVKVHIDPNDSHKIRFKPTPNMVYGYYQNSTWNQDISKLEGQIYYLSFCKGHRLTIKVNNTKPTNMYISTRSRGVV